MPRRVSQKQAERFLLSKQEWALKHLQTLNSRNCKSSLPPEGGHIEVRGRVHRIDLASGESDVEEAIWRLLRQEALDYLPGRVKDLAKRHGFEIQGIKIRKMHSRWGSCTARKNINLNSWLVMLPDYLSDYVILHELVHTRVPDHSKRFWDELDSLTGGQSKQYRRELRRKQIMCFADKGPHQ
jgi:predicted metal-dependent hydrolase